MKLLRLTAIVLILASTTKAQVAPVATPTTDVRTPAPAPTPPPAPVPPAVPKPAVGSKTGTTSKSKSDTSHFRIGSLKFTVVDDSAHKHKDGKYVDWSDDDDDNDSATIQKNKKHSERRIARRLRHLPHWSGFEMGINGFTSPSGSLKMPKGYDFLDLRYNVSYTVNLNFWEKSINLCKNYVHLYTGMGLEWNNFKFSKQMSLLPGIDSIKSVSNTNQYDVNKLTLFYLNVPLMLEFNTSHNKRHTFHLAGGLIVGYLMDSYTKEIFKSGNNVEHEVYQEDDFGIDPFRFSAAVRVGYGKLNVFATYGLNKMFNNGPDIHPFTVGLTLIGL